MHPANPRFPFLIVFGCTAFFSCALWMILTPVALWEGWQGPFTGLAVLLMPIGIYAVFILGLTMLSLDFQPDADDRGELRKLLDRKQSGGLPIHTQRSRPRAGRLGRAPESDRTDDCSALSALDRLLMFKSRQPSAES